jgi:hypothetical protein
MHVVLMMTTASRPSPMLRFSLHVQSLPYLIVWGEELHCRVPEYAITSAYKTQHGWK